jgi:guanylate cyclase
MNGFWDSLAGRLRPTDTLKTIEDPGIVARAYSLGLWAATMLAVVSAAVSAAFGEPAAAWTALAVALVFAAAWVWFATTGSVAVAVVVAFAGGTAGTVVAHVALGGYAYSGAVMLFGIAYLSTVALLLGRTMTIVAALVYAASGVTLGLVEQTLQAGREPPDPALSTIVFVVVLVGSITLVAPLIVFFMERLSHERARAERLLLNVLPAEVASELKDTGTSRARRFESASVLFADIVGFTPLSAGKEPEETVELLNEVFTAFDRLAARHGVEKIRTIGDGYMAASGVPVARADHAEALALLALDMLAHVRHGSVSVRIGINSGPLVAGVVGTLKFQYDLWGDTVNTASRMESHGEPDRIQISRATRELVKDRFETSRRGPIEIKGKGTLVTWWLEGEREPTAGPARPRPPDQANPG